MDAESRWAQRKQWDWENRRGVHIEIQRVSCINPDQDNICCVKRCERQAVTRYEVNDIEIDLCQEHDSRDAAYEQYAKTLETQAEESDDDY